jgi:hypothetical protein
VVASSTVIADPRGAHSLGKASYGVSTAGIIITVIIIVIVVAVVVSAANSTVHHLQNNIESSCNYYINYRCYSFRLYFSISYCYDIGNYYSSDEYCFVLILGLLKGDVEKTLPLTDL